MSGLMPRFTFWRLSVAWHGFQDHVAAPGHCCAGRASGPPARHRGAEFRAASRPAAPAGSGEAGKSRGILAGVDWDALVLHPGDTVCAWGRLVRNADGDWFEGRSRFR